MIDPSLSRPCAPSCYMPSGCRFAGQFDYQLRSQSLAYHNFLSVAAPIRPNQPSANAESRRKMRRKTSNNTHFPQLLPISDCLQPCFSLYPYPRRPTFVRFGLQRLHPSPYRPTFKSACGPTKFRPLPVASPHAHPRLPLSLEGRKLAVTPYFRPFFALSV